MSDNRSHTDVRDAVARLCADFPGEYWRDKDRDKQYPTEFVEALTEGGFLHKYKHGRSNYYINVALIAILTRDALTQGSQ